MQKVGLLLVFIMVFCLCGNSFAVQKDLPPVQSTQGLESVPVKQFDEVKQSVEDKSEQKEQKNRLNKCRRINKQIERQDRIKTKRQRELEYYEGRLENTKSKLEVLNPTLDEKGEK